MPGEAGWRGLKWARPPPASPSDLFSTSSVPAHIHWLFKAGLPGPTQSSVLRGTQENKESGPGRVADEVTVPSAAIGVGSKTALAGMG